MTASERIYHLLLNAYPARYRREYAESMSQLFRDQLCTAASAGKLLQLWIRTILDLARTVPARHLERLPRYFVVYGFGQAPRALFFAHYEACSFSRSKITLDDLMLGVLRADKGLQSRLGGEAAVIDFVSRIERTSPPRRRGPVWSVDLGLSDECRQVVNAAKSTGQGRFTTRTLIAAILRQENSQAAKLLREFGITADY